MYPPRAAWYRKLLSGLALPASSTATPTDDETSCRPVAVTVCCAEDRLAPCWSQSRTLIGIVLPLL